MYRASRRSSFGPGFDSQRVHHLMPIKNLEKRREYDRKRNRVRGNVYAVKTARPDRYYLRPWERSKIMLLHQAEAEVSALGIARMMGISSRTVYDVINGKTKQRQLGHGVQAVL